MPLALFSVPPLFLLPLHFPHAFSPFLLLQLSLHPVDPVVVAGVVVGHGSGYELVGIDKALITGSEWKQISMRHHRGKQAGDFIDRPHLTVWPHGLGPKRGVLSRTVTSGDFPARVCHSQAII
jgi:hypothetical protein